MAYTVSEMAYFFDNTKGAIRFYEEKGLLTPRRDESGYRQYSGEDLIQLFYLRRYREFGFSVQETVEYFRSDNTRDIREINSYLEHREEELEVMIIRYRRMKEWLADHRYRLARYFDGPDCFYENYVDGYYYLDMDYFESADQAKKAVIHQWIQASPWTHVHISMRDPDDHDSGKLPGIGILKEDAVMLDLPIPAEAHCMPPVHTMVCMIEGNGQDFQADCREQVERKQQQLREQGYVLKGYPHLTLLFSNQAGGIEQKYYELHLDIEKDGTNT